MWRRVGLFYSDVSEEYVASIFRVEKLTRVKVLDVCKQTGYTLRRALDENFGKRRWAVVTNEG
jgi:hypothetical protein